MLVLEVIAQGPSYGYEIAQTVAGRSDGTFEMKEGSLYPALHRLERQKFLKSTWREADGRRRKYYELTKAGRAELASRKAVVAAVRRRNQRRAGDQSSRRWSRVPASLTWWISPPTNQRSWIFAMVSRLICLLLAMTSRPACATTSWTSWPTTWPACIAGSCCAGRMQARRRQRVLERFGDPAAVARRLWFDAMKGKIMAQRILVSCCVLLTLLSLTLAGFMMMQLEQSRRMAAMMLARESEQARVAHAAQEQMLKQLAAMSKAVENPRSPDWIPVSFKLTQETLDGPPGVGFQARWVVALVVRTSLKRSSEIRTPME